MVHYGPHYRRGVSVSTVPDFPTRHSGEVAADAEGRAGVDATQARIESFTSE